MPGLIPNPLGPLGLSSFQKNTAGEAFAQMLFLFAGKLLAPLKIALLVEAKMFGHIATPIFFSKILRATTIHNLYNFENRVNKLLAKAFFAKTSAGGGYFHPAELFTLKILNRRRQRF